MVQLGILLTRQHRLLSVAAMLDVFDTANRFYGLDGAAPLFRISLIYAGEQLPMSYPQYELHRLANAPQQDIILIPAFAPEELAPAIQANHDCVPFLLDQHQQGAEIASFCSGAFLLAATGLLNGKMATTHIHAAAAFTKAFPQVQLQAGKIITQDKGVYTSGGATNSFHLMLRIVEKYCGLEMAVRTAKYFAIDMDREQQHYFGTFKPSLAHNDELVNALQCRIQKQYGENYNVEDMMSEIPASRRNLVRRFKDATGFTPIEYLQQTRVEGAKGLLEKTSQSILEVMLNCGYNDMKTFRRLFRRTTGMTPTEYRGKFSRSGRKEVVA